MNTDGYKNISSNKGIIDLVSICIPVYNAIRFIEIQINSFLNQTYKNIEILVQDDFSNDGTWELLKEKYSDNDKIKLERNVKNLGIGPGWNNVYKRATGEFIVIANADDIHESTFIDKAVSILKHNKSVNFCSFKYKLLFESNKESKFTPENINRKSELYENPIDALVLENPFHIIFTMFRASCLNKLTNNNQLDLFMNTQVCDYELMLKVSKDNKLYYSDELAGYYRIHDSNVSKRPLGEIKSFYNDVLKVWHPILKKLALKAYKKRMINNFINYIKSVIRGRNKFDISLAFNMMKRIF